MLFDQLVRKLANICTLAAAILRTDTLVKNQHLKCANLYCSQAAELFEEWTAIMPIEMVLSLELRDLYGAERLTDGSYRLLRAPTTPIDADLFQRTKSYRLELLNRPLVPASPRLFVGEDGVPLSPRTAAPGP